MLYKRFPSVAIMLILLVHPVLSSVVYTLSYDGFNVPSPLTQDDRIFSREYWILWLDEPPGYQVSSVESRMLYSARVQESVVKLLEGFGAEVVHRHWIINAITFRAPPEVAYRLVSQGYKVYPSIILKPQYIAPSRLDSMEPHDPIGSITIGATRLHTLGITGAGVRIAIIDTGVENNHPWLIRDGRSVVAWEVDATGTGVVDYCGKRIGMYEGGIHGTHVAGIIASQKPGNVGVAPGALIYDIIAAREELWCFWFLGGDLIKALELALLGPDGMPNTGDEADVINLSLGAIIPPWWVAAYMGILEGGVIIDPLYEAIKRAVSMGKFVVVAAGNEAGHMTINILCSVTGVICVGSSNQMGTPGDTSDDELSVFSSRGPLPWFDPAPTIVAPGERIYSSIPTQLAAKWGLGEPALELSGTSMATPHVSGALALMIEYYRKTGRILTLDLALKLLSQSASDLLSTWANLNVERISYYRAGPLEAGAGLVNVYNAVFSELIVEIDGSYKKSIVALEGNVTFTVTLRNLAVTDKTVEVKVVRLYDILRPEQYLPESFDVYARVSPRTITIPPLGSANITVTIDTSRILPGFYGGDVVLVDVGGGRTYKAIFSLVIPGKLVREGYRLYSEIPLLIGRFSGLYWALFEWTPVLFYIDKPLNEMASIRVTITDLCAAPASIKVFDVRTGHLVYYGSSGYILAKPGLYIVLLELGDTLYWWYGFVCKSYWGKVILEAPLFETTSDMLLSRVVSLEARVSSLEDRVSVLEGRLGSLESKVSMLEARIRGLEDRVSSLSTEIQVIKSDVTAINNSVRELSLKVLNLDSRLSALVSNLSMLQSRLSSVESRVSNLESSIAGIMRDISSLREELSKLRVELASQIELLSRDLKVARAELEQLSSKLVALEDSLRKELEGVKGSIGELNVKLEIAIREQRETLMRLNETLRNLDGRLVEANRTLSLRISQAEVILREHESRLRSLAGEAEKLRGDVALLSRDLGETRATLEHRINMLQDQSSRNTVIGLAALLTGLGALGVATYTLIRRRI